MPNFVSRSSNTAVALSTTYARIAVGVVGDPLPSRFRGGVLIISVDTIASSAAQLTVKLTSDTAGDIAVTGEMTRSIVIGQTTNTDGTIAIDLAGYPFVALPTPTGASGAAATAGADGTLHVWAKTNTGTCNGVAILTGSY